MKIIFDGMNIVYRCYFIHDKKQNLSTSEGQPTGITYGFIRTILKWKEEYSDSSFHIAWDTMDEETWRKEKYSDYKERRSGEKDKKEKKEYDFHGQIEKLRKEFLPAMGIEQFQSQGQEADDIIATLVEKWSDKPKIIVSNDKDFFQLISENTVVITPDMNNTYDKEHLEDEYELPPNWIVPFRALDGDNSDNLPGLPYFRKKVIRRLVKDYEGDISSLYNEEFPEYLTDKESSKLEEFEEQALLNEELMNLKPIDSFEKTSSEKNLEKISSLFENYEFQSLTDKISLLDSDSSGFMKTS